MLARTRPHERLAQRARERHPPDVEPEPVAYREEVIGMMFAVADILEEVRRIRHVLEDDDGEEEEEGFRD